jgi:hypothetical protein
MNMAQYLAGHIRRPYCLTAGHAGSLRAPRGAIAPRSPGHRVGGKCFVESPFSWWPRPRKLEGGLISPTASHTPCFLSHGVPWILRKLLCVGTLRLVAGHPAQFSMSPHWALLWGLPSLSPSRVLGTCHTGSAVTLVVSLCLLGPVDTGQRQCLPGPLTFQGPPHLSLQVCPPQAGDPLCWGNSTPRWSPFWLPLL